MIRRRRSEFGRDQRGGVAIFFGFALPVLLVGAGAAVEYASLTHRRGQLQKAADTAALTAARELTLANADDARVKSVAPARHSRRPCLHTRRRSRSVRRTETHTPVR